MKKTLVDILFGFSAILIVTICEFLVTLPFGEPGEVSPDSLSSFINLELLLTALPAGFTTYMLSRLRKTKSKSDSIRMAIIWAIMLALNYIIIGFGNDNLSVIFRTIGIYILLVCAFAGPIAYAKFEHLKYTETS